jgi:peptidoglycan hydrolase CwlO-like protein
MSFKKKIVAGALLSTVALSAVAPVTPLFHMNVAHATVTDAQIAAAEATIANAQASSQDAQAALNTLQASVDEAKAKAEQLKAESIATNAQIMDLKKKIDLRNESLKTQARSAQTNGSLSSYINTVLNSKSLTDVVQKVTAMSQVVKASNEMMQQQKKDEAALEVKLEQNTKAYNEATALEQQLNVQKHNLDAAKALYDATIASSQEERNQLLNKRAEEQAAAKAEADRQAAAAKAAAEAEAQRAAEQQQQNTDSSGRLVVDIPSSGGYSTPSYSTSGNPFPVGQCTWGVYEILGGRMPAYKGNAGDWAVYANTSTPAAGEIIVFSAASEGNGYGHVAVINSVNSDGTVNISEANYNGNPNITSRSNVSVSGASFIVPA